MSLLPHPPWTEQVSKTGQRGCALSGGSRGQPVPVLSQLLGHLHCLAVVLGRPHIPLTLTLLYPSYEDPVRALGPPDHPG